MLKRLRYYFDRIKLTDNRTTTYRYTIAVTDDTGRKVRGKVSASGSQMLSGGEFLDKSDGGSINIVQNDLYESVCHVAFAGRADRGETWSMPTFWDNGQAYTIERTHKLKPDKPTFIIAIPAEKLGIATPEKDVSLNKNFVAPTLTAADFCLRAIAPYFEAINAEYANRSRPDKDNGKFYMHYPSPKILRRNTAYFAMLEAPNYESLGGNRILVDLEKDAPPDIFCLCIRMEVQLPHMKIDRAAKMLCNQMPAATERFIKEFNKKGLQAALELEKTQHEIRQFLRENGYAAFIANGSILARKRGGDSPAENSVPFTSPPSHEIQIAGITGMGIKRGVTVITGGGYSGKSTVLNAVSAGIYNHIAGDGRELCITDDTAVTITAEDGRAVSAVNISPFIKWIPGGNPEDFSTTHASGSTSQGANIMEAVALGAKLLLIDEDRSATNFMIRDAVMKRLIKREPITPFTDRVRELAGMGISTILVIGGSGEYLGVADNILMMDEFVMSEVTLEAKALVDGSAIAAIPPANWSNRRMLQARFSPYPAGSGKEKLEISDTGFIILGDERIDIRSLHDIATPCQINALAFILRYLSKNNEGIEDLEAMALAMRGLRPIQKSSAKCIDIAEKVSEVYAELEIRGLNMVDTNFFLEVNRFMEMPRLYEVMASINRMRYVVWEKQVE